MGMSVRICTHRVHEGMLSDRGAMTVRPARGAILRRLRRPVISGKSDHPSPAAHSFVEKGEEGAELAIESQKIVELLATERAVRVAHAVCR